MFEYIFISFKHFKLKFIFIFKYFNFDPSVREDLVHTLKYMMSTILEYLFINKISYFVMGKLNQP